MFRFHFSRFSGRVILSLTAAAIMGCAGATPTYEGPRKPAAEVAIASGDVRVRILKIDSKNVRGSAFEILPGDHQIDYKVVFMGEEIGGAFEGMRRTCYANAKFIADAGQEYRAMRVSKKGKTKDTAGATFFQHDFGVYLQNYTTGEALPDAMSEMKCGT